MANRCVNPFYHRFQLRTSDYFTIVFGTLFLVPIRVILMVFLFILSSMFAKFSNYLLELWKLEKAQETKWRKYLQIPTVFCLRAMFFISGFYNIKVVDKGGPNDEEVTRIIVAAPHTSPFDLIVGLSLGNPSPVARHDSVDIPFFGNIIKIVDPVFVERESQSSRDNVVRSVLEKIKFLRIVFFPEGTTCNRRALLQFKPGAFRPGLPVQLVAVKFDQYGGPDTLSWAWDGPPVWKSLWFTLCRWSTGFELTKLPVYYPSEDERKDPDLYAKNVSETLSKELGIPTLKYSFDDIKYLQYKVFKSPVCLKFLKVCDKILNQTKVTNGFKINNNFHSNGPENGVNRVNRLLFKNKSQIFSEGVIDIIRDILEKIELNSSKEIKSSEEFISWINLDKYTELCQSLSLKEFYNCLVNSKKNINTTHLAVVLQLCDMREQNFWKRLENSFNSLAKTRLNGESNTISNESLRALLWLALGVESICDKVLPINDKTTFDNLKLILMKDFFDCVEENASELLKD